MGQACSVEGSNCVFKRREQTQEIVTFRASATQISDFINRVSSREFIDMMSRSKQKTHHIEAELSKIDWTPEALMQGEAIIYEVLSDIVVEGHEANDLLEALIEYSPNFRSNPGYQELERGRLYFQHYLEGYVMLITLQNKQRNWWHHHKKFKESSLQEEVESLKKYLKQHYDLKLEHNKNLEVDIKAFSTECTVREPVLLGILELSAIYLNELFDYAIETLGKM